MVLVHVTALENPEHLGDADFLGIGARNSVTWLQGLAAPRRHDQKEGAHRCRCASG